MTIVEGATANASRENRRAIPVSCGVHGGPRGFTNLVVELKPNGDIVLDPQVTGECVIIFDEIAARTLFKLLGTWLGCTSTPAAYCCGQQRSCW
jgi:hypothetical protein